MIKDIKVPIFIIIFSVFLNLFENSISKIIMLHEAQFMANKNPVVTFEIVKNQGAAWGIFQNSRILLIIFAILIILFALYYAIKNLTFQNKFEVLSFALFIGGAFGNMLERIRWGYVLDYIKIQFISFPNFNIFDICIVCGILLFIASYLIAQRSKQ